MTKNTSTAMKVVAMVLLSALIATPTVSTSPVKQSEDRLIGSKAVLSQKGVQYVVDTLLPYINDVVLAMWFSEIDGSTKISLLGNVTYHVDHLRITEIDLSSTTVTLESPDRIGVVIPSGHISFACNWSYKEIRWPHKSDGGLLSGSAEIGSFSLATTMGTSESGKPSIERTEASLSLGDVKAKISGSGSDALYQGIIDAALPSICKVIESEMSTTLPPLIDELGSEALSSVPIQENITFDIGFDYSFSDAVKVGNYGMIAALRGEVFANIEGSGHTPGTPSALPDGETSQMVELYLSDWTLASISRALWRTNAFTKIHTLSDAKTSSVSYLFTAKYYKNIAPWLPATYGDDAEIAIVSSAMLTPELKLATAGFAAYTPTELAFLVMDSAKDQYTLAFTAVSNVTYKGTLSVKNGLLVGEVKLADHSAAAVETPLGSVDSEALADAIRGALELAADHASSVLAKGITIPSFIGIQVYDSEIIWGDNYVLISTDGSYTPPGNFIRACYLKKKLLSAKNQ